MENSPEIQPTVESQEWQELASSLPPLGVFAGLSDRSLETLAIFGRYESFPAGTEVIREGQPQDRFYVVVSGKLVITANAGGREVQLNVAEVGECLGEVNLLEPSSASASVKVLEDATVLWSMNLSDLREYLSVHAGGGGSLLMGMAQCLSQRIRQANALIAEYHAKPVETVAWNSDNAITAANTTVQLGFFDRIKRSMASERKVRISNEIKL